ncbi:MAG: hypothetical protein Q8O26_01800 [Phreatobacter sp.]|uniref:hypothetical protein n=1 Tax=Phreatobacter sp. TaxID=1966341 RepID=UPI0027364BB9|nr:hypothetical protein [Phreatobacter sp.]MDP2800593.1 hypothetical protein [Phreatobacter sp.]
MGTFFSDSFGIDPAVLEEYGAFDISLINDLPLFIDPFLLFHSEKEEYKVLHNKIIDYLVFLRERALSGSISEGQLRNWYCFPEVKQNWLGFSMVGNGGSGLGVDFAKALHSNLGVLFGDFGKERITKGSHLEKLCLIADGVGCDNISDFVTNLIQEFICEYTAKFAKENLRDDQVRVVFIERALFNYRTESWQRRAYKLPWHKDDHVILTPKDMLTRDDTWINRQDLLAKFEGIPSAIPDDQLRASINNYFQIELDRRTSPDEKLSAKDKIGAIYDTIRKFPSIIDYYIKIKELDGDGAEEISSENVLLTELFFSKRLRETLQPALALSGFYGLAGGTYAEAHARLAYLKRAIEEQGCWRIFYDDNGNPVEREKDVQILYRLVWFGTPSDIGREANDGRGPVDFKASRGRHKTLIEMKLAKNTKLEMNLKKQVEAYQDASDAERAIKCIIFFKREQYDRVKSIIKRLNLEGNPDIVLIDARSDNKPSASKID